MVLVPTSYPKEPGATRCGDTYKTTVTVTGEIPGTDYTGGFSKNIGPVPFLGTSADVPLFKSKQQFNEAVDRTNGLASRLVSIEHSFFVEDFRFSSKERKALQWLIDQTKATLKLASESASKIVEQALPGTPSDTGGYRKKTQSLLIETLKHLRCAEYWTWRVILHGQALETYVPEMGHRRTRSKSPLESALPPPPTPPSSSPSTTSEPKKKKKSNTALVVLGLAAVVGVAYYYTKTSQ